MQRTLGPRKFPYDDRSTSEPPRAPAQALPLDLVRLARGFLWDLGLARLRPRTMAGGQGALADGASMALGSYVAGSTPMGGGTVGFPVLVLFFKMPATLGRDFSFAIQSIGMVSAAIFIIARRTPLAWSMLKGSMVGALVGFPLGIFLIAPFIPGLWIKAHSLPSSGPASACSISIGSMKSRRMTGMTEFDERWDFRVGLAIGLFSGATIVAVTGVGIDMVLYAALILLCRADLKIAIPTSVVIMGFSSALGVLMKHLTTGLQPGVYENWLAAAPVVALGAPLGVFVVNADRAQADAAFSSPCSASVNSSGPVARSARTWRSRV